MPENRRKYAKNNVLVAGIDALFDSLRVEWDFIAPRS